MTATTYLLLLLNPVLTKGDSLVNLIEQADSLFFLEVQDSVAALIVRNAALSDSLWHTWCEKRYNAIALKWLAGHGPDSAATEDLRLIAQTCLSEGGRAVLGARGLCEVWLKEHYGEDGCIDSRQERGAKQKTETVTSPVLAVMPNPASDIVRVRIVAEEIVEVPLIVQVLSLDGREVYTVELASGSSEFNIPVRNWSNGMYLVRVAGGAKFLKSSFIVLHR